jgi:hypothetical protein
VLSVGIEGHEAGRRKLRRGEPGENGCLPTHIVHGGLVVRAGITAQHEVPRLPKAVEDRDVVNRRRDAAVEPAYPQRLLVGTQHGRQPRAIGT